MRRKVPFVGEERIARATSDEADAKKTNGRAIDEVLSTYLGSSSWEDYVPSSEPETPKPQRANSSISRQARHGIMPISQGATLKKAVIDSNVRARIDWIPINNGHGLRINIAGNLDQSSREEWRRLLDETANNGIDQFEFNMTQAPSLSLTGLGMLLMFKEQKGSERGDIKLCHCNKDVWQILQWTGMDKYFVIQGGPGNAS